MASDKPSLRDFVSVKKDKDILNWKKLQKQWINASLKNRLTYEIDWLESYNPDSWRYDIVQELIFKIKPDFIIETGIAHGGSLMYYASLLEMIGKGRGNRSRHRHKRT